VRTPRRLAALRGAALLLVAIASGGSASAQPRTGQRAPSPASAQPAHDDFHYGIVHDTPHPANPDMVSDSAAWLRDHGIREFPKDEACWQTLPMDPPEYMMNACVCDQLYRIAGRELLTCSRFKDATSASLVPGAQHLVMYDITRGSMRLVLDEAIGASSDNLLPSPVRLEVSATDTDLLLGEHGNECAHSLEAFRALEHDPVWGPSARPAEAIYSQVCASRGRYQWRRDRFVRVGDAPPVLVRAHPYPIT
jgi:hypothetical protein